MTYAARPTDFQRHIAPYGRPVDFKAPPRQRFLTRLFNAIFESRERQAARAVEAYLARTGHRLTDSIEREISEHFFNGGWNARR